MSNDTQRGEKRGILSTDRAKKIKDADADADDDTDAQTE